MIQPPPPKPDLPPPQDEPPPKEEPSEQEEPAVDETEIYKPKVGAEPAEKPDDLPPDVRKADELLARAKETLKRWNDIRTRRGAGAEARKLMESAKKSLEQAKELYRKALEQQPDSQYLKKQLDLANQLHYFTLKSSGF